MSEASDDSVRQTSSGELEPPEVGDESVSDSSAHSHGVSASLPSSKRLKVNVPSIGVDRLSSLPESLIVHILSFLSIGQQIRTAVLSKAWEYLWTRVPELYFDQDQNDGPEDSDNYIDFIGNTLFLCDGSKVKSLGVKCSYQSRKARSFDSWIRFAARNGIENFQLDFSWDTDCDTYELPQHIFTNSSFQELEFGYCVVHPKGPVDWKSLKRLIITSSELENDAIQNIIDGTPKLEDLNLWLLESYYRMNFSNSSVRKLFLEIKDGPRSGGECGLEITAPHVESLYISGYLKNCKLVDATSLVEATLCGHRFTDAIDIHGVLRSLVHVPTLGLNTWVVKGIATLLASGLSLSYPKCKCLKITKNDMWWESSYLGIAKFPEIFPAIETLMIIEYSYSNYYKKTSELWNLGFHLPFPKCKYLRIPMMDMREVNPSAVANFLKSFPEMETLIITIPCNESFQTNILECHNSKANQEWISAEISFNFLTRLRTVDFCGFRGDAFPFVQFLLKHAKVLQKMTINLDLKWNRKHVGHKELFEVSRRLLSFPRSSPDAELLFYE